MGRFCGVLTQMRSAFLTAPFCPNISNNAKDENIGVRSRAIHCASYTNSENTCRITGFYEMWRRTAQTKSLCYKWDKWEIYNQKWYYIQRKEAQ